MEAIAALAFEPSQPLHVDTLQVAPPGPGELLVKLEVTSVCHWDMLALHGHLPQIRFPSVLGHEAAGKVVDVGPGVTHFMIGDPVVPLFLPECGQCPVCRSQRGNLCEALRSTYPMGLMPDGTTRFSHNDQPVYHGFGPATWSQYVVLPDICAVRIPHEVPMEEACFLGCTLPTGVGAVLQTARVAAGATVAVFGLGGVGLSVVQAAVMAQAERILVIDTNINHFELATALGATDCLNPLDFSDDIDLIIQDKTQGGVDHAFECLGLPQAMQTALNACHPAHGQAVLVRTAPQGEHLTLSPSTFLTGRSMIGARFGGVRGRSQLPHYAELLRQHQLQVSPLITHRLPIKDINLAFDLLHSGAGLRTALHFE